MTLFDLLRDEDNVSMSRKTFNSALFDFPGMAKQNFGTCFVSQRLTKLKAFICFNCFLFQVKSFIILDVGGRKDISFHYKGI